MKAIETRYKGYRFRSRLEARWAVFFDSLGIQWEYEPEGFEFDDGTRYLPDFLLKNMKHEVSYGDKRFFDVYVEIKAAGTKEEDWTKAKKLSNDHLVLLLAGTPSLTRVDSLCGPSECEKFDGWHGFNSPPATEKASAFVVFFSNNELCISDVVDRKNPPRFLVEAVEASRSSRFEFGECGVVV